MTREELRDYVEEKRSLNNIPYHVYSALIDGIDTLEQEPRWIPVSESLPKEDGRYLCTYEDDIEENCVVDFGSYENGEWYVDKVIAWMPLPPSYEPQERSEE